MKKSIGRIAIIGLGYVGLPLAVGFSKKYDVIGFDLNAKRINELKRNYDNTKEISKSGLLSASNIYFTNKKSDLELADHFIITVPTPINKKNEPDLSYLIEASKTVSTYIKKGSHIIYESTVYPGATEEVCLPILKKGTRLNFNTDFYLGYSPERINPGDKNHKLEDIVKVTAGSNKSSAKFINELYASIITAGTYKATSIKVAEAAKVIENTQRDLNIALINELSLIFKKLNIDTSEVLQAANTKWNFLDFRPGLVGGHCIGVDPYYLTHKSKKVGYVPKIILAGRELNNAMSKNVGKELIKSILHKRSKKGPINILILGATFKENCPDTRNSKVFDLIHYLESKSCNVDLYDPWVSGNTKVPFKLLAKLKKNKKYHGIILAVPHSSFQRMGVKKIKSMLSKDGIFYDLKSIFGKNHADLRL